MGVTASSVLTPAETEPLQLLAGPHRLPRNHPAWLALKTLSKDLTALPVTTVNAHLQNYCSPFVTNNVYTHNFEMLVEFAISALGNLPAEAKTASNTLVLLRVFIKAFGDLAPLPQLSITWGVPISEAILTQMGLTSEAMVSAVGVESAPPVMEDLQAPSSAPGAATAMPAAGALPVAAPTPVSSAPVAAATAAAAADTAHSPASPAAAPLGTLSPLWMRFVSAAGAALADGPPPVRGAAADALLALCAHPALCAAVAASPTLAPALVAALLGTLAPGRRVDTAAVGPARAASASATGGEPATPRVAAAGASLLPLSQPQAHDMRLVAAGGWAWAYWAGSVLARPLMRTVGFVGSILRRRTAGSGATAEERAALLLLALCVQDLEHGVACATLAAARDMDDSDDAPARVHFGTLFVALARLVAHEAGPGPCGVSDAGVLLLYMLLYRNRAFMNYVLARTDIDCLVLPLLRQLYESRGKTPQQLYMPLITLLLLSLHQQFHAQLHSVVSDVGWCQERRLPQISLGSLVVVVVVRTVLRNFAAGHDTYLTTNCLALLGNLARHLYDLHHYAADRLVLLIRLLHKRVSRLTDEAELELYTGFLRLIVQIVHMVLGATTQRLPTQRNAHLVYSLMQRADVLDALVQMQTLGESATVLRDVVAYYTRSIVPSEDLSVDDALAAISAQAVHIAQPPALQFTYSEDASSGEFFAPFVWAVIAAVMGWEMPQGSVDVHVEPAGEPPAAATSASATAPAPALAAASTSTSPATAATATVPSAADTTVTVAVSGDRS